MSGSSQSQQQRGGQDLSPAAISRQPASSQIWKMNPGTSNFEPRPAATKENSVRRLPLQAGVLDAEEVVWEAEASPRVCGHSLLPQAATGCKRTATSAVGESRNRLFNDKHELIR
ncbi:hypothetical protein AVEN_214968-1 [Araneus ventricosus]|uniref:Uncharacterized protein n=1 Tax=Araneus ventricosus TaxID=182803 RepID=A0A4Y2M7T0_ARAVE|nr:hypothetical protein AVEN_214968-1 [Araneus ventricosus]